MIKDKSYLESLETKIKNKTVKVGIIGLGYVGLPLMLGFAERDIQVIGFDIDDKKIEYLNAGKSYIKHINNKLITRNIEKKTIQVTSNFSTILDVDAIILCVPTPLNKYREPDLSYIVNTMETILPYVKKGQLISLESTTYPGTTEEEIVSRLENKGFKVGEDFFVVYSPEREDPGNKSFSTTTIPKVLGGHTPQCSQIGEKLYSSSITRVVTD